MRNGHRRQTKNVCLVHGLHGPRQEVHQYNVQTQKTYTLPQNPPRDRVVLMSSRWAACLSVSTLSICWIITLLFLFITVGWGPRIYGLANITN